MLFPDAPTVARNGPGRLDAGQAPRRGGRGRRRRGCRRARHGPGRGRRPRASRGVGSGSRREVPRNVATSFLANGSVTVATPSGPQVAGRSRRYAATLAPTSARVRAASIRSAPARRSASERNIATPMSGYFLIRPARASCSMTHSRERLQRDAVLLGPVAGEEPHLPGHLPRPEDLQDRLAPLGRRRGELDPALVDDEETRLPLPGPHQRGTPLHRHRARVRRDLPLLLWGERLEDRDERDAGLVHGSSIDRCAARRVRASRPRSERPGGPARLRTAPRGPAAGTPPGRGPARGRPLPGR